VKITLILTAYGVLHLVEQLI